MDETARSSGRLEAIGGCGGSSGRRSRRCSRRRRISWCAVLWCRCCLSSIESCSSIAAQTALCPLPLPTPRARVHNGRPHLRAPGHTNHGRVRERAEPCVEHGALGVAVDCVAGGIVEVDGLVVVAGELDDGEGIVAGAQARVEEGRGRCRHSGCSRQRGCDVCQCCSRTAVSFLKASNRRLQSRKLFSGAARRTLITIRRAIRGTLAKDEHVTACLLSHFDG